MHDKNNVESCYNVVPFCSFTEFQLSNSLYWNERMQESERKRRVID